MAAYHIYGIGNALVVGLTNDSPAWGLFNGMAPENVAFDPLGALKTLSTVGRDDTAGASYVGKSGHVLAWSRWGVDTVITDAVDRIRFIPAQEIPPPA